MSTPWVHNCVGDSNTQSNLVSSAAAALTGDPPTGVLRLERRAPAHTPRDITHLVDPMTGGRALQR